MIPAFFVLLSKYVPDCEILVGLGMVRETNVEETDLDILDAVVSIHIGERFIGEG